MHSLVVFTIRSGKIGLLETRLHVVQGMLPGKAIYITIFVASPFAGKPLSHTQTAVRGERCPNFREAA